VVECLCYLLVGGPLELVVLLGEADLLHHVPAPESSAAEGVSNNRGRNQEPEHVEKAEQKGVVDDDDG
jgi:hypothetical protein